MKNCFKAFGVSFNVDSDTLAVADVRHSEGLAAKWHEPAMLVDYPYEAWGYIKDSHVFLSDFAAHLEQVIEATRKSGEETADFLTNCGDFEGGVMLNPDYEVYGDYVDDGVRLLINFSFYCELDSEDTDSQCYSVVYLTTELFEELFDVDSVIFN